MAGTAGGDGLGKVAITYGLNKRQYDVMYAASIVLVLLVVPIQMGLEWCFDRCTTALDRRRERLAKRRRAPRRPRPAHRSRRRR